MLWIKRKFILMIHLIAYKLSKILTIYIRIL